MPRNTPSHSGQVPPRIPGQLDVFEVLSLIDKANGTDDAQESARLVAEATGKVQQHRPMTAAQVVAAKMTKE